MNQTSQNTAATDDTAGNSAGFHRNGIIYGFAAYFSWGFLPLYFRMLDHVRAMEIVANRVIWSFFLLLVILAFRRTLRQFGKLVRNKQSMLILGATARLIACNWLGYIWAVNNGHVIAASLGYFLNPLVNVLLGFWILKERHGRLQWAAVGLAALGVAILAATALDTLWISLTLACSFSLYGLIRKMAPVTPLQGLAGETLILTPVSVLYLIWLGDIGAFGIASDLTTNSLLVASGVITTVPLLLFAVAAKRMPYSTLGLLQYIAPTLQFLLGVLVFGETLGRGQLWSFGLIWTGLILYTADSFRRGRMERRAISAV
ncbi:EamA family transporter RarD [Rhizorhapis sp. SPR117]|uniref:EamA family transporter RarD n=1 Tax=Rhizorhapis sp. SPR117 TaxID=2912611 RepID=UPI001F0180E3|nr:EamA family transporter RarD [Rhizorhapis sp. SPR117]